MILAIDIGNTNIVIGCCADGQVIFRERVSTNPTATVLEYAAMLKMAFDMNRADITAVDGAILSSVVPADTPMRTGNCPPGRVYQGENIFCLVENGFTLRRAYRAFYSKAQVRQWLRRKR